MSRSTLCLALALAPACARTLGASGKDVWHSDNFFHFIYQPLDGDGEIVACIVSVNSATSGSWGVMVRNEPLFTDPAQPGAMVFYGGKRVIWADWTKTGGGAGDGWGPYPFVTAPRRSRTG